MGLRNYLLSVMDKRPPDFIIGSVKDPYLLRWWLTPWSGLYRDVPDEKKTRWQKFVRSLPNAYVHLFLRSDDDTALHDHPWMCNCSVLLKGNYIEWVPDKAVASWGGDPAQYPLSFARTEGSWYFRWGRAVHRVELFNERVVTPHKEANLIGGGVVALKPKPCVTLFLTGFLVREWGFHCPKGWVNWKIFTSTSGGVSTVGRGCE